VKLLLILMVLDSVAHAQFGWTLDQCRKHWGKEIPSTFATYSFGPKDLVTGIQIEVTLDAQYKANEVWYSSSGGGRYDNKPSLLDIPGLLATEAGIVWEKDPDRPNGCFLGKKDGVVVFHARYFSGKTGESLHVAPIESEL
jgi:hypothetical protein